MPPLCVVITKALKELPSHMQKFREVVQEFNGKICHIQGVQNQVWDSMLCALIGSTLEVAEKIKID